MPACSRCGGPISDYRPSRNSRFCSRACANRSRMGRDTCSVGGCGKPDHALGYCMKHYQRIRSSGDPTRGRWPHWTERFERNLGPIDPVTGCKNWQGSIGSTGYGRLWRDGKSVSAHSVAYFLAHGAVPDGLEIDHICFNRKCINPVHLEAVTRAENLRRRDTRKAATPCC